jgi:hypothetical protein
LKPATDADKRTLLRRATFDLTGLPPSPGEISSFLADSSTKAFERVVDRLLASSHFTATTSFPPSTTMSHDQFIREQIAGDLLPNPRYTPDGSRLESPLGSTFFGLHEERNAADDFAEVRCEKTDNQIDVLGKAFLGPTVACARCHDHKFEPIPTADYYSLSGILYSTRQAEFQLDSMPVKQKMQTLRDEIRAINRRIDARTPEESLGSRYTLVEPRSGHDRHHRRRRERPTHILYPLAKLRTESSMPFTERLAELRAELKAGATEMEKRGDIVFADFRSGDYNGWDIQGPAFGTAPVSFVPPNLALSGYRGGGWRAVSGPDQMYSPASRIRIVSSPSSASCTCG